jgi:transposase
MGSGRAVDTPAKRGGNKQTVDLREIVNGLMYMLGTGCQSRDIPKDLPPRGAIHDYLDRWTTTGRYNASITRSMSSAGTWLSGKQARRTR